MSNDFRDIQIETPYEPSSIFVEMAKEARQELIDQGMDPLKLEAWLDKSTSVIMKEFFGEENK